MSHKRISHPLKDAIMKKYKSIGVFCETAGIEKQVLYYFFKGRTRYLRDDTKMIICKALGISINDLWEILYGQDRFIV